MRTVKEEVIIVVARLEWASESVTGELVKLAAVY